MTFVPISAEALLAELGIRDPEDIDIEAIARHCEARVVYENLKGCAARIVGYGDQAYITVDSSAARGRQRFSVGHELGHWMLDRKRGSFACQERAFATEWTPENPGPEQLANRYAKELLLPASMFEPRAKGLPMTFASVRSLAQQFTMSLTATAIRLVELGSFPAMLVCSESRRRKWFVRGPDVPDVIWPLDTIQPGTFASDLFDGAAQSIDTVEMYASDWVTPCSSARYGIMESSVRITGSLVLTLLWWKEEQQLFDLDEDAEGDE
jgi:Zn-dependent peptidase ImmA (M78 family)